MKKQFFISTLLVFVLTGLLCTSCEKDDYPILNVDKQETGLTAQQLEQRENLKSIALIVANIATSRELFHEIHKGVNVSLDVGLDEQFRFKDILYPTESKIQALKASEVGQFGIKFRDAIRANRTKSTLQEDLEAFILREDVQIYWPYSEYWDGIEEPVITFHPIEEDAYENTGFRTVFMPDGSTRIDTIIVDEAFAIENPVWIINFNESEIEQGRRPFLPPTNPVLPPTNLVHQVSIGYARATVQYDGLFGGGSEFKVCFIGGRVTSWNTAESFKAIQTIIFTRREIRRGSWKRFYYELDDDWRISPEVNEGGRKFGLIEFDRRSTTREITFEPKVKIKETTISLGKITWTTESKEGWIKVDTFECRDQMMRTQFIDMGLGLIDRFRVHGAGGVYWTLPIRRF